MSTSTGRMTTRLRQLIANGCVAMPGAFNAYVARLIQRAGFDACYISGAGLANATAGVPDIGLLSLEEVARLASYICDAVRIPVLADADTGFGGAAKVVSASNAAISGIGAAARLDLGASNGWGASGRAPAISASGLLPVTD